MQYCALNHCLIKSAGLTITVGPVLVHKTHNLPFSWSCIGALVVLLCGSLCHPVKLETGPPFLHFKVGMGPYFDRQAAGLLQAQTD